MQITELVTGDFTNYIFNFIKYFIVSLVTASAVFGLFYSPKDLTFKELSKTYNNSLKLAIKVVGGFYGVVALATIFFILNLHFAYYLVSKNSNTVNPNTIMDIFKNINYLYVIVGCFVLSPFISLCLVKFYNKIQTTGAAMNLGLIFGGIGYWTINLSAALEKLGTDYRENIDSSLMFYLRDGFSKIGVGAVVVVFLIVMLSKDKKSEQVEEAI